MFSGFSQDKKTADEKIFNNDLRQAHAYFERAYYAKAIPLYEAVNSKQRITKVVENLATCYYNVGNLKASARLYGYLVNSKRGNKTDAHIFKYIQALKASGNYADANSVNREFLLEKGDVSAIEAFEAEVVKQDNIRAIGNRYHLDNLAINSEHSEFGMVPYKEFLVYAAARKQAYKKNIFSGYYGWNDQPFLDIYKIDKDSVSKGNTAAKSISTDINTKLHEGTVAFSKDLKTIYFTRNNFTKGKEVKDDKLVTHLKLYRAEWVDSLWTNIEPLPFNGDTFSVEHPALSKDGTRLYFSSDMPGTLGSFDLFYVDIKADDTYGAPVNLGSKINTKHREQFPFIATNGDLYFSSNGHFALANSKVTLTLVSAEGDDVIATCITKADGVFNDVSNCELTLIVKASANGYQDAQRKIRIGDQRNSKNDASLALVSLASINKKEQEKQQIALEKQKKLEQEKLKQEQEKRKEAAEKKKKQYNNIIASEPNIVNQKDKLVITTPNINFDYKLWYIRKDVKKVLQPVVDLMRKYPNMQIEIASHTDIRGHKAYNKDLSQKRANSTMAYFISKGIDAHRISAVGYGESQPIQDCETEDACSEEEHEINRRSEFVIKQLQ